MSFLEAIETDMAKNGKRSSFLLPRIEEEMKGGRGRGERKTWLFASGKRKRNCRLEKKMEASKKDERSINKEETERRKQKKR